MAEGITNHESRIANRESTFCKAHSSMYHQEHGAHHQHSPSSLNDFLRGQAVVSQNEAFLHARAEERCRVMTPPTTLIVKPPTVDVDFFSNSAVLHSRYQPEREREIPRDKIHTNAPLQYNKHQAGPSHMQPQVCSSASRVPSSNKTRCRDNFDRVWLCLRWMRNLLSFFSLVPPELRQARPCRNAQGETNLFPKLVSYA